MEREFWKVGELARLTGVSVRALHHYDAIGLLKPSQHSDSGYRLYNQSDVVRLGQIKMLQNMGFSLEDVRACLTRADFSPQAVVRLHLARLKEQVQLQQKLCARLEAAQAHLQAQQTASAQEFIEIIKEIMMFEKYYTPEQLAELEERRQAVGEARIREVQGEWEQLREDVSAAMQRGDDPSSPNVQELAQRWMSLVNEFTGGNPQIESSLNRMYAEEPTIHGMDVGPWREMGDYINRALKASQ